MQPSSGSDNRVQKESMDIDHDPNDMKTVDNRVQKESMDIDHDPNDMKTVDSCLADDHEPNDKKTFDSLLDVDYDQEVCHIECYYVEMLFML